MPAARVVSSRHEDALSEIPPEVLEHIFFWTAQIEMQDAKCRSPRAFAQVSHFWRSNALGSPRLWSQIPPVVTDWDNRSSAFSKRAQFLELFLQRSKGQLLSFSLTAPHFAEVGTPQYTSTFAVVLMLLEHSDRWGDISLNLDRQFLTMFLGAQARIPMLNTLHLSISGHDPFNITYFEDAPALRHVSIRCRDFEDYWSLVRKKWAITLPWPQLETYTEDSSYHSGFSRVLSCSSTNLTSVKVSTSQFDPMASIGTPAHHDRLTYLSLDNSDPHTPRGFFAKDLVLPSLKDLHITYRTSLVAPSIEDVTLFIVQSDCALHRLTLLGLIINPGALSSMFWHCSDLEELTIDFIPEVDLQELIIKEGLSEVLVPKLFRLALRYPVHFIMENTLNKLDGRALNQVVRSRVDLPRRSHGSSNASALLNITIHFTTPNVAQTVLEQLEGWPSVRTDDAERVKMVKNWAAVVTHQIRKQRNLVASKRSSFWDGLPFKSGPDEDLKKILTEMEEFNPIEGVNLTLVYNHKILESLESLVSLGSGKSLLGLRGDKTSSLASAVLTKWKALLMDHAIEHRQWVFRGEKELFFLRANDERRTVEKAWDIVAGIQEEP